MVCADDPPGTTAAVWDHLRIEWLNKRGWDEAGKRQLKENLDIDVDTPAYTERKIVKVKVANGDVVEVRVPKPGDFVCPVCGAILEGVPYSEDGQGLAGFDNANEFCPECDTQYCFQEMLDETDPPGSLERAWQVLRLTWLNRTGWQLDHLRQLKENLDIDVETLKTTCMVPKKGPFNLSSRSKSWHPIRLNIIKLKFCNGEVRELRVFEEGGYICPICGQKFPGEIPYGIGVADGFAMGTHEYCPNCSFPFGKFDIVGPEFPIGTVEKAWGKWRIDWLNKKGWTDRNLKRLKDNLDMDVEALKKEAGR